MHKKGGRLNLLLELVLQWKWAAAAPAAAAAAAAADAALKELGTCDVPKQISPARLLGFVY